MSNQPFIHLDAQQSSRWLSVPPGHHGFVLGETGRVFLEPGLHRLVARAARTVYLVRVGSPQALALGSLGRAMLRDDAGRRQPIQVRGRLLYDIERSDLLVDLLEREQMCDPRQLEGELVRTVAALVSGVFDGEPLPAGELSHHLDLASGELQRRLAAALKPFGIGVQGLDLVAEAAGSVTAGLPVAPA
jgi:hypothetical protein